MAVAGGVCGVRKWSTEEMRFPDLWTGTAFLIALAARSAYGQTGTDPVHFYTDKVKPLLSAKCYACHTQTAMGGLRLDSREALMKGGNSGPATAPGPASNSLLMQVVTHTHAKIKMPPGGRLSDGEIA